MKHFTRDVVMQNIITMSPHDEFSSERFLGVQRALITSMGANPHYLSASEESTLTSFISWFKTVKEDFANIQSGEFFYYRSPLFVYCNLTTGETLVVNVADYDGVIFGTPELFVQDSKSSFTKE